MAAHCLLHHGGDVDVSMSLVHLVKNKVLLCPGDAWHFLKDNPDNRYDSMVSDPPYALVSIVKRFGLPTAAPAKGNDAYIRASSGFMGKQWDTGKMAFDPEFWSEVYRVLKPGGHVAAFGSSRGYHRMACAIEDAGFEIRDSLMWIYGTGFPKSHNQGDGWGTALKPAFEPIVLARKPLSEKTVAANVLKWGTGAINVDGCRVGTEGGTRKESSSDKSQTDSVGGYLNAQAGELIPGLGRWPANVCHDGSAEVVGMFPQSNGQQAAVTGYEPSSKTNAIYGQFNGRPATEPRNDSGSAARFFYSAKADGDSRAGSKHPTVKPVDLMQWLIRLVTPRNGLVLDPFAGTGTTAEAALYEGMRCILVEKEAEYIDDIRRRLSLYGMGSSQRTYELAKLKPIDLGPLFAQ
jgi:site-specific DNA-methyltransferase (adenine-specific)